MFILLLMLVTMFFYSNTIFYTLSLLLRVVALLSYLVYFRFLSPLTRLMLALVYIGAMIILIGYICAISPNVTTFSPLPAHIKISVLFFILILAILVLSNPLSQFEIGRNPLSYLFGMGYTLISLIIFLLFVTLLIVTSQYTSPRGPFRAL